MLQIFIEQAELDPGKFWCSYPQMFELSVDLN